MKHPNMYKNSLRRITVGFYGYIGQKYILAYFQSKIPEMYKKVKKN